MLNSTPCGEFVEINGIKIPFGSHLSPLMVHVYNSLTYEAEELEIIANTLSKNDRVMEIGAGTGFLASYCSKIVGSERVFAFEANPFLEDAIKKTFTLNSVSPELNICMLGEVEGSNPFYLHEDFWASSAQKRENARVIQTECREFDKELLRIKPTYLIIDIEGGEYDLLIRKKLPGVEWLVIEIHPSALGQHKVLELIEHLNEIGLRIDRRKTFQGQSARISASRRLFEYSRDLLERLPLGVGSILERAFRTLLSHQFNEQRSYCFRRFSR